MSRSLLNEWMERPIPAALPHPTFSAYSEVKPDTDDSRFREPLVDISTLGIRGESLYAREDGLNAPYYRRVTVRPQKVWLRSGVVSRLANINALLAPLGVEIYVLDGYRPIECQQALWDFFMERARVVLDNPSEEECVEFTKGFVADPRRFEPSDPSSWTLHITGGAVDLTLIRKENGQELYMGGIFDDPHEVSSPRYYEGAAQETSFSFTEAKRNRRLLYWAMHELGFTNHHNEWWHFDYGTQLWVVKKASTEIVHSFYGPAELPAGYR